MELHAFINNADILLCHLDFSRGILQQSLDLQISEGEAIVLYAKTASDEEEGSIHLSGYLVDEPTDCQWEAEFTEDDEEEEDEEVEEEDGKLNYLVNRVCRTV